MNTNISVRGVVAACLTLGMAACGGGGGGDSVTSPAPSTVSAPDNSTIESFRAYQQTLAPVQTIDPQTLQKQLAPIDDTAEPTPIN